MSNESENKNDKIIDTDKYEGHTEGKWRWYEGARHKTLIGVMLFGEDGNNEHPKPADAQLIADAPLLLQAYEEKCKEVKRLRLLFRELINDMNADDYIEWCNKIGCPDGLEVYAMTGDE